MDSQSLGAGIMLVMCIFTLFMAVLTLVTMVQMLRAAEDLRVMRKERLEDVKRPWPYEHVLAGCLITAVVLTLVIVFAGNAVMDQVVDSYRSALLQSSTAALTQR